MRYLHTMFRVADLERSLRFYRDGLGFEVVSRRDYPDGKFTLVFLRSGGGGAHEPMLELTHNWETASYERGDAFGHVAYRVDSIAAVQARLKQHGYDLSWGPGKTPDGRRAMAFVDDPAVVRGSMRSRASRGAQKIASKTASRPARLASAYGRRTTPTV